MTETDQFCEGCGAPVRCYDDLWVESGLTLNIGGHHGGFNDDFSGKNFRNLLMLCHDCVLRLVKLFPILHLKFEAVCHPSPDTPCCPYGWTSTDEGNVVLTPNESLTGWVPMWEDEV